MAIFGYSAKQVAEYASLYARLENSMARFEEFSGRAGFKVGVRGDSRLVDHLEAKREIDEERLGIFAHNFALAIENYERGVPTDVREQIHKRTDKEHFERQKRKLTEYLR